MNLSDLSKKIAFNTAFQLIGKVISMTITVLITVLVARYFGREAYGQFSLMQNWPALFFIIVDFGMNAIAVREISSDWNLAGKYFGTVLFIRIIFSVLLSLLLVPLILIFPYTPYLKTGIILSLLLILTQGLYATGNIIFQTKMKYNLSTYAYLLGYFVILILTGLAVKFNLGVIAVSVSYVFGGIVTFAFMLFYIKKNFSDIHYSVDLTVAKSLLINSLPLGLMFIFSQINFKSDSILLSVLHLPEQYKLSNTDSVAVYSLPYKIFEVSLVIPTFFMNSMYPVFLEKLHRSKEELGKIFVKSIQALVVLALVGSIAGFMLAPIVINLLGGPEFALSVPVLRILLSGLIIYFCTQPISWLIVTLGHQKKLPYIYLISAIINVTLNYIFIQRYSFFASSIITHISELSILIMLVYVAKRVWKESYA